MNRYVAMERAQVSGDGDGVTLSGLGSTGEGPLGYSIDPIRAGFPSLRTHARLSHRAWSEQWKRFGRAANADRAQLRAANQRLSTALASAQAEIAQLRQQLAAQTGAAQEG